MCIILQMQRKVITSVLISVYLVTIPTLLAFHVHPLGIGSGQVAIIPSASEMLPSSSGATKSVACQICSRLASVDLLLIDSESFVLEHYGQLSEFSQGQTFPRLLLQSVQLRAPPRPVVA